MVLLQGRRYCAVEFHALRRYPLKCDSSGWRGMVHRRSVPAPHPPPCFSEEVGVPVKIRSTSSPAVSTCRCISYFSVSLIAHPSHLKLVWYRPGSCLAETLLSMSLYVSSDIHKLWRAATWQRSCTPASLSEVWSVGVVGASYDQGIMSAPSGRRCKGTP